MDQLLVKSATGTNVLLTFDGAIVETFGWKRLNQRYHVAVYLPDITVDKKGRVFLGPGSSAFPSVSGAADLIFEGDDAQQVREFWERVMEAARVAGGRGTGTS
jgi:hypothetical protein